MPRGANGHVITHIGHTLLDSLFNMHSVVYVPVGFIYKPYTFSWT